MSETLLFLFRSLSLSLSFRRRPRMTRPRRPCGSARAARAIKRDLAADRDRARRRAAGRIGGARARFVVVAVATGRRTPLEPSRRICLRRGWPVRQLLVVVSFCFFFPPPTPRSAPPSSLARSAYPIPRSLCFPRARPPKTQTKTNLRRRLRQPTSSRRRRPCPAPSPRAPTFATCAATSARSTRRFGRRQLRSEWFPRSEKPAATPPRPPTPTVATWARKTSRRRRRGGAITTCSQL